MAVKITCTFRDILNTSYWDEFCEAYGYSPWMINEGLADDEETISITFAEARKWGIIKDA